MNLTVNTQIPMLVVKRVLLFSCHSISSMFIFSGIEYKLGNVLNVKIVLQGFNES